MKQSLSPYVHFWPAPAVLLGCGTLERPNLIAVSWFGVACSEPPMVTAAVRPSRHSFGLIRESGEFTVNFPRAQDVKAVDFCGNRSGREVDKFRALGLTPVACPPLERAPMVKEFFAAMGCRVRQEIPLGSHYLFLAEVVSIWCDESYVRKSGKVNPSVLEQIVWVDRKYWRLKEIS